MHMRTCTLQFAHAHKRHAHAHTVIGKAHAVHLRCRLPHSDGLEAGQPARPCGLARRQELIRGTISSTAEEEEQEA